MCIRKTDLTSWDWKVSNDDIIWVVSLSDLLQCSHASLYCRSTGNWLSSSTWSVLTLVWPTMTTSLPRSISRRHKSSQDWLSIWLVCEVQENVTSGNKLHNPYRSSLRLVSVNVSSNYISSFKVFLANGPVSRKRTWLNSSWRSRESRASLTRCIMIVPAAHLWPTYPRCVPLFISSLRFMTT